MPGSCSAARTHANGTASIRGTRTAIIAPVSTPPRILILATSAGAGHVIAARGLEQAFRAARPELEVERLDALELMSRFFRGLYAGGYSALVRYAPPLMGWLYDALDQRPKGPNERLRLFIQNRFTPPLARYLVRRSPHLIVSTHFLPAEVVAELRRDGRLRCPHAIVTTDLETHRLWVQEPAERYYTATESGRHGLTTWGVAAERVRVTGIPVRAGFAEVLDANAARARVGLAADRPVVLVLYSWFSPRLLAQVVRELLTLPRDTQLAVMVGRNVELGCRLAQQARTAGRELHVVGFTDEVHVWMRAADVAIGKPGGLTVSEALACGLPLAILQPIPGQETRNSDYLLEQGAGLKLNHPRMVAWRIGQLLSDADRLRAMRQAAARLGRPHAARDIAADALRLLR